MRTVLTALALVSMAGCLKSERQHPIGPSAPREAVDDEFGGILPRPDEPRRTSVYRMLAVPDAFDNRWVTTDGYVVADFEGCAIWPSREDYERGLIANAIWLDFDEALKGRLPHRVYAEITGIFSSKQHGHMGLFQSSLRVMSWSAPIAPVQKVEVPNPESSVLAQPEIGLVLNKPAKNAGR